MSKKEKKENDIGFGDAVGIAIAGYLLISVMVWVSGGIADYYVTSKVEEKLKKNMVTDCDEHWSGNTHYSYCIQRLRKDI